MGHVCDRAEVDDLAERFLKVSCACCVSSGLKLSVTGCLIIGLEPSGAHSVKSFRGIFKQRALGLCAWSRACFPILSSRGVFEHIPAKCDGAVMAVWGHLFNTLGSWLWPRCGHTTGGISHAPIVNLPILFTNTAYNNQPDLPAWIASDIICLNLLKAHVDCRSLEWPWCVTLTVLCHLKSETTKWKQLCFLLLWGRPAREA